MKIWLAIHLYPPAMGQLLENLPFCSMPWRFCNCYGFFLVFEILNFRQINATQQKRSGNFIEFFRDGCDVTLGCWCSHTSQQHQVSSQQQIQTDAISHIAVSDNS